MVKRSSNAFLKNAKSLELGMQIITAYKLKT
jgi:hypothetical protein